MKAEQFVVDSPLGNIAVNISSDGLRELKKTSQKTLISPQTPFGQLVKSQLKNYFSKQRHHFELKLDLQGTDFQKKVWAELQKIPYGTTVSYGEIAHRVGRPKAARAVGSANHRNPLWIVVPCHRVVGAKGQLTGYAGGIDAKVFLLNLEGATMV